MLPHAQVQVNHLILRRKQSRTRDYMKSMNNPPQQPKPSIHDAYDYLLAIKAEVDKESYDQFLSIMKDFKTGESSKAESINRVSELFADNMKLLDGFNVFLPDDKRTA